jgi:hypothetical protein
VNPVRRLAAALREMRWSHVAVEFALLVAGILMALAIDGWIDARRDARMERQYLELLTRDLDRDLEALAEVLEFEERQAAAGALAFRALRERVPPQDREAVAAALNQLTARRTLRLSRATYTDLLSTGNLRLIRNADLRDRIVTLYEANERTQMIRDRNNQMFVDQMYMSGLLDSGLVAPRPSRQLPTISRTDQAFADRVGTATIANDDRLWHLAPEAPEWDVLAGKVWYRSIVSQSAIEQSRQSEAEIRAVRDAIAGELASRWPK